MKASIVCLAKHTNTELLYLVMFSHLGDGFHPYFAPPQDPSIFRLSEHSLDVGTAYEFRVDVTDSLGYTSFATQVRCSLHLEQGRAGTLCGHRTHAHNIKLLIAPIVVVEELAVGNRPVIFHSAVGCVRSK